jgi:hypothetical protein
MRLGGRRRFVAGLCLALLASVAGCGSAPVPSGAPHPSPVTSSAAPSPSPSVSPAPAPFVVPSGVVAGIAVYDRRAGAFVVQRQATTRFRSASLVKLLIALDYLWNRGPGYAIPAADRGRLDLMLRSSDDDAASYFWNSDGHDQVVTRMIGRLGLKDTAPPSAVNKSGWGATTLSAADIVRTYRYLLDSAPAPVRDYVMGNLHQSTPCGSDRYTQTFGIPSAFNRPWAVKQGWYGFGDTPANPCTASAAAARPDPGTVTVGIMSGAVLHTTGTVGDGDRTIVAVLTQHPEGTSFATAAAMLTKLTRSLPVPGGVPLPVG